MKFCTQVFRTCVHKCLVSDFHSFAKIESQRREFQPINICNFLRKIARDKHAQAYKKHK